MLQQLINVRMLYLSMLFSMLRIILIYAAIMYWSVSTFIDFAIDNPYIIMIGCGFVAFFLEEFIVGPAIRDSSLFQGKTNTIQKACLLLGIVFFFATAGFGANQVEIAGVTTGLMVASFAGYFLFKDK